MDLSAMGDSFNGILTLYDGKWQKKSFNIQKAMKRREINGEWWKWTVVRIMEKHKKGMEFELNAVIIHNDTLKRMLMNSDYNETIV